MLNPSKQSIPSLRLNQSTSRFLLRLIALVLVLNQLSISSADSLAEKDEFHPGCGPVGHSQPPRIVCTCSSGQCEELDFQWPKKVGEARLVRTSRSGARFETSPLEPHELDMSQDQDSAKRAPPTHIINVNMTARRQQILGWGGAFTDAALINVDSLGGDLPDKLISSYYGPKGLQYNFARVPIAGTDFSTRNYTYDDSPTRDLQLDHWSLAIEDEKLKIPYLRRAAQLTQETGQELKVFASPWSPPAWMKTSGSLIRGKLIDEDSIYKSYAEYLMRFYDAYERKGVKFWGATVQNEPAIAFDPSYYFNSLEMGTNQTIKFISKYLGPSLEAQGKTKENFKLMINDDSLGFINEQVPQVLADPGVQRYVSGLAFHWYTSGRNQPYDKLTECIDEIKDKIQFAIMTEACAGWSPGDSGVDLGNWTRAELYANDIIEDVIRGAGAWIDWNIALDRIGGPNWAKNYVDSPIVVNTNDNEFYKQPMYYALAHFSRFFRPGSQRLETSIRTVHSENSDSMSCGLKVASVINDETGHLVINILNQCSLPQQVSFKLAFPDGQDKYNLPDILVESRSISTVVLKM